MNPRLPDAVCRQHSKHFGQPPQYMAYAPGRVEILGNHTDYNGGLALAAAIDSGICAAVSRRSEPSANLLALDLNEAVNFALHIPGPGQADTSGNPLPLWAKYIAGVANGLPIGTGAHGGFDLSFSGNIPRGAGLSSSAALAVASALVLAALTNEKITPLDIATLCQRAENEFAGARCGLLDQLSSLFGADNALVAIDFQTLAARPITLPSAVVCLIADTGVRHTLAESSYNDRRHQCEAAARFCAEILNRPITVLRDVAPAEFERLAPKMDAVIARRAKHVFDENRRVQEAIANLERGALADFGQLMFASHQSSRENFENSCPELDYLVEQAQQMPEVIGARLSGGGFGGSVVIMTQPAAADAIATALQKSFQERFHSSGPIRAIRPAAGARLL